MGGVTVNRLPEPAPAVEPAPDGTGLPSRPDLGRDARRALTAAAFAVPLLAYLAFISHYTVNDIWYDQWWDVQLLGHWYSGTLSVPDLWAQHGENRILFPNLIVIGLAWATRLNTVTEQYLSAMFLSVSAALIIWSHKRRSPSIGWIWYWPVAALLLSFVQYQNTLWGFQLAWYLVLLALAVSLILLDRPTLNWLATAGAIAAAVVGSYSSLQGLLIWPAGLVLLYHRRRPWGLWLAWVGSAAVTTVVYFYHLDLRTAGGSSSYASGHFVSEAKYFLLAIGDVFGIAIPQGSSGNTGILIAAGAAILIVACWSLIVYGRRRDQSGGTPIGVALTSFGLMFAALMTVGRAAGGLSVASTSRYTTFDLLIPVGCYLTLLGQLKHGRTEPAGVPVPEPVGHRTAPDGTSPPPPVSDGGRRPRWPRVSPAIAIAVVLAAIAGQLLVGTFEGLANARGWYEAQVVTADVTANSAKAPKSLLANTLLPTCNCLFAAQLPQLIQVAREHRLSLFGTHEAATYTKRGLYAETTAPVTEVARPRSGTRLSGGQWLSASASDNYGVTRVEFHLTGGSFNQALIAVAQPFPYGWLAGWDTRSVPNGTYTLQSFAYNPGGRVARSSPVAVVVAN